MPTYVYRCKTCQVTHNHTHGINENPLPPCPMCGGFSERIVSNAPPVMRKESSPPDHKAGHVHDHTCNHGCAWHRYHPH